MNVLPHLKTIFRNLLVLFKIDLTKNLKYDRLTKIILQKHVKDSSICVDVGCHKGEILDHILLNSPNQKHYAFEPIPDLYDKLLIKYGKKCKIYPYAISHENGSSSFKHVKNAQAYSGIHERNYHIKNPNIEEIQVSLKKLDDIILRDSIIDLIKIDVEGGEFSVLRGAEETINRSKPIIIFECGKGASEKYESTPEKIFDFTENKIKMNIYTLQNFINNSSSLTKEEFCRHYNSGSEYYFVIN